MHQPSSARRQPRDIVSEPVCICDWSFTPRLYPRPNPARRRTGSHVGGRRHFPDEDPALRSNAYDNLAIGRDSHCRHASAVSCADARGQAVVVMPHLVTCQRAQHEHTVRASLGRLMTAAFGAQHRTTAAFAGGGRVQRSHRYRGRRRLLPTPKAKAVATNRTVPLVLLPESDRH